MTQFDTATMRARFHAAVAERDALRTKTAPLRKAFEEKSREIDELRRVQLLPLRTAMIQAEAPIFPLDEEIAALARALKGKTSEPQGAGEAGQGT